MVITVFGDTDRKPRKEQAEAKLVEQLNPIVRAMPGFISNNACVRENGEEIGIIRFDSPKSLDEWMQESLNAEFQKEAGRPDLRALLDPDGRNVP
jgi:antibiotic biosynthesis monooxygenase (ABM) superfamily enzyme